MNPKQMVRSGYDKVSYAYRSRSFDYESSEYGRFVSSWLASRLAPGSAVLDLGCGCGVPVSLVLSGDRKVTEIDISPVQIERARRLVPDAEFICSDMTEAGFEPASFDAIVAFYSIIHIPLEEQPALLADISRWLRPSGYLLASVGHGAWTGTEPDWCDIEGATMYWSHADAATYRQWLMENGLSIIEEEFLPEGTGGHTILLCRKM